MIVADRKHLQDLIQQEAVRIREKEERLLLFNFGTLAKLSTYLCASSFAVLYSTPTYRTSLNKGTKYTEYGFRNMNGSDEESLEIEMALMGLASISIGFNVMVMMISSWCLIFGEELATRGMESGSMGRAIDGLVTERKWAIRYFMAGAACTLTSGIIHILIAVRWVDNGMYKLPPMLALSAFGVAILLYVRFRVRERFKFPDGYAKTGPLQLSGGFNPEIRQYADGFDVVSDDVFGLQNPLVDDAY